jgi:predicted heme/steroid binding protein
LTARKTGPPISAIKALFMMFQREGSGLWKNGLHVMKHPAGNDLTEILRNAPHGEDKILAMPQVGVLQTSQEKPKKPFHLKLFYFFAYMNLVLVFVITFIIALWRWW